MDSASPPRVLESSPQKLAVGIRDAGLGWIEIRTHAIGGHVAATLASGTQEAHTAIAAELPAIRDTLVNQHIALHSLSAERFSTSSGGGGSGTDTADSGQPARSPSTKEKAEPPSAQNEAEGASLSYISVRV
jgi:flagellar hook-length control protein FliK